MNYVVCELMSLLPLKLGNVRITKQPVCCRCRQEREGASVRYAVNRSVIVQAVHEIAIAECGIFISPYRLKS